MSEEYIQYKNMTYEQKRAYHNQKNREYRDRLAALQGRTINHRKPGSHPSQMNTTTTWPTGDTSRKDTDKDKNY